MYISVCHKCIANKLSLFKRSARFNCVKHLDELFIMKKKKPSKFKIFKEYYKLFKGSIINVLPKFNYR